MNCTFPSIPAGTLQNYGVTSRTHYLAWKLSKTYFCENDTDGRAIVLLENPSRTVIDHITDWIEWVMGAGSFVYLYPYQKAVQELIRRAEEEGKDTDRAIDLMRYKNLYSRTIGAGNPHNLPETWTN